MPSRSVDPAATPRARRLERDVFLAQLLLAAVVLILVVMLALLSPHSIENVAFLTGISIVFAATMAAAVGRWSNWPRWCVAILPIADIAAVIFIRVGEPEIGAGLLLIFPVTWLAGHFGRTGAVLGPALSSVLVWVSTGASEPGTLHLDDLPRLVLLPITLIFIATGTYQTARRSGAQRRLLEQQSRLMARSFDTARAEERRLDAVLNAVSFAVVAYDAAGARTHRNEAFRRLKLRYGTFAVAHAEGRVFTEDRETPLAVEDMPTTRLARGEEFDEQVLWMTSAVAPPIALAVTGRQLVDGAGASHGSMLVQRDITGDLQALRAREDLIASVSHELRTPLTSILGYLELVTDEPDLPEDARGQLAVVTGNAERMLAIVSDLLHVARDSHRAFLLALAPCDLEQIVHDAVAAARPAAAERRLTLTAHTPGPVPLVADGFRLRQVIDNLVTNAVKYNRENGSVTVRVEDRGAAGVRLVVADTGLGMSDADRAHMFKRFYRADAMRRTTIHGTGLGLSISQDIITQHGGEITVASELDAGTIVTVELPRERGKTA